MAEISPDESKAAKSSWSTLLVRILVWTPSWLRWDPDANNELTWGLNILFGVVSLSLFTALSRASSIQSDLISYLKSPSPY